MPPSNALAKLIAAEALFAPSAGKTLEEQRINAQNAEATAQRLVERLHKRQEELGRERQITALPPVLKGAALIIPKGLLTARCAPSAPPTNGGFSEDPGARALIEKAAMDAVMAAEWEQGNLPRPKHLRRRDEGRVV